MLYDESTTMSDYSDNFEDNRYFGFAGETWYDCVACGEVVPSIHEHWREEHPNLPVPRSKYGPI